MGKVDPVITISYAKNVHFVTFGKGALGGLGGLLEKRRISGGDVVFFIDRFFRDSEICRGMPVREKDPLIFVPTDEEPTTDYVNSLYHDLKVRCDQLPVAVVGMGGGCTLDTAKAVSNLLTNGGRSEDYQGWDLVKVSGVYKIGIPTISGTGAETSRTCVLMNKARNLKLGMNSEYTIFDELILDPELPETVPRNEYFYTGMDTYIHCIESLAGENRHPIGDAYSLQALSLCREVFGSEQMQSYENREKLMVASYMGGCAIANSLVGLVHPFSAGLSVTLGVHHGLANCIALNALDEFYPVEVAEFRAFLAKQRVTLPMGITGGLSQDGIERLYASTVIHEKPLANALGARFKEVLTRERVKEIFERM
jgi:3-deoxy-alpha-D-manno-octulosonate 8-oxidase